MEKPDSLRQPALSSLALPSALFPSWGDAARPTVERRGPCLPGINVQATGSAIVLSEAPLIWGPRPRQPSDTHVMSLHLRLEQSAFCHPQGNNVTYRGN